MTMHAMDDQELLRDYAERRSEAAFTELVRRHLDWVHAAAWRQTGDAALAQDVAQSVFALLARKARPVATGAKVGGWLFNTTRFLAARARRAEVRRRRREEAVSTMNIPPAEDTETVWQSLAPRLEEAVASLPEADRAAVLLRFYERKALREVGERLGTTEEGARKRVSRAVEKMRDYLTRRGTTLSATMLAAVLAERLVSAAPAALVASVVSGVLGTAGGAASLPELAKDALSAWSWTRLKFAAGLAVVASLVLLFLGRQPGPNRDGAAPVAASRSTAPENSMTARANATTPAATTVDRETPQTGPMLILAALDPATGRGIAGARVYFNRVLNDDWQQHQGFATDERGLCSIPLPEGLARLDVGVVQDGFVARYATWFPFRDDPVPPNYTFKLTPAETIGGVVVDDSNQPVPNAAIHFSFDNTGDASARETPRERVGCLQWFPITRTDAAGRWHCAISAPGATGFSLEVRHEEFPSRSFSLGSFELDRDELKRQQARLQLKRGAQLAGTVLDDQGRPIAGAKVWAGNEQSPDGLATSDGAGRFVLRKLKASSCVTALADGFAPQQAELQTNTEAAPFAFRLVPSPVLRVRVVDDTGEPVPRATIALEEWTEGRRYTLEFRRNTDDDGRLEWRSAPAGTITICALKSGYRYTRDVPIQADGNEHPITLRRALVVAGRVTDADTGEPVTSFKAIPGYGPTRPNWHRSSRAMGRDGSYRLSFEEAGTPVVQILAEGYEPEQAEPQILSPTEGTHDFQLHRADQARAIRGTVLLPDGQPAAGVEVALCSANVGVTLVGKFFRRRLDSGAGGDVLAEHLTATDAKGEFSFKRLPTAHTVIAVGPAGLGKARVRNTNAVVIPLQGWGQITGTVRIRGQPVAGRKVVWSPPGTLTDWRTLSYDTDALAAMTDAEGRFTLVDVPPGDAHVAVRDGPGKPASHTTPVVVPPGGSVEAVIGGTGVTVIGRLKAPAWEALDWAAQFQSAELDTTWKGMPNLPRNLGDAALQEWKLDAWDAPEGVALRQAKRTYAVTVAADGAFAVPDVEPGDYDLRVKLSGIKPGTRVASRLTKGSSVSSSLYGHVTIPARVSEDTFPVDLGEILVR